MDELQAIQVYLDKVKQQINDIFDKRANRKNILNERLTDLREELR